VDFEDPACCAAAGAMTVSKLGIAGGPKGTRLTLAAALAESGVVAGDAITQDLVLQVRGPAGPLLCAHVPAASLVRKKGGLSFSDRRRRLTSAAGVQKLRLRTKRDGSGALRAGGRGMSLAVPPAGEVALTLGLRDAQGGGACARAQVVLEASKKGALRLP
jgi:hypothetical protein